METDEGADEAEVLDEALDEPEAAELVSPELRSRPGPLETEPLPPTEEEPAKANLPVE